MVAPKRNLNALGRTSIQSSQDPFSTLESKEDRGKDRVTADPIKEVRNLDLRKKFIPYMFKRPFQPRGEDKIFSGKLEEKFCVIGQVLNS